MDSSLQAEVLWNLHLRQELRLEDFEQNMHENIKLTFTWPTTSIFFFFPVFSGVFGTKNKISRWLGVKLLKHGFRNLRPSPVGSRVGSPTIPWKCRAGWGRAGAIGGSVHQGAGFTSSKSSSCTWRTTTSERLEISFLVGGFGSRGLFACYCSRWFF